MINDVIALVVCSPLLAGLFWWAYWEGLANEERRKNGRSAFTGHMTDRFLGRPILEKEASYRKKANKGKLIGITIFAGVMLTMLVLSYFGIIGRN